jgi:ADP-ribosylglycohydrolase
MNPPVAPFNAIKSLLFGVALGDAPGVPVEFKSRDYLKENSVKEKIYLILRQDLLKG